MLRVLVFSVRAGAALANGTLVEPPTNLRTM
jgi:hypothetical protein